MNFLGLDNLYFKVVYENPLKTENDIFHNGIYCITAVNSNKAIGIIKNENEQLVQYGHECTPEFAFIFDYSHSGNIYNFINISTLKSVTEHVIPGNVHPVILTKYSMCSKPIQYWNIVKFKNGEFQIFNTKTGYLFDIEYNSNMDKAKLISYVHNHKGKNQRFKIIPIKFLQIEPPQPDANIRAKGYVVRKRANFFNKGIYCMTVLNSNKSVDLAKKGDRQIYLNGTDCTPEYTYQVMQLGGKNVYRLMNVASGKFLTENVIKGTFNRVMLAEKDDITDVRQKWKIIRYKNKEFQILNVKTKYTFDIQYNSTINGTRLMTFLHNYEGIEQRFKFTLVGIK